MENHINVKKTINQICQSLKEEIGGKALVAISGGVDSTTAAALIKKARIKNKLLFIDTGFLRQDETKQVLASLKKAGFKVELLNASKAFLKAQQKKSCPTRKGALLESFIFQSCKNT